MFDFDLALLYETETKTLNQAIKRNSKRFPADFMFRLTIKEWQAMRSQSGVAMLSGVLNSDMAINMNITIMRAFVEIRKILLRDEDLKEHLKEIRERLDEHDVQLNSIYDALENLLDEKVA